MSNKVDLSIIVPVYNVSKYIEECLISLVAQNLSNYEIIIVNDGSTDNSLEICKKFATKYKYTTIITQENRGLGAARNFGISYAKGKYLGFVDSDDYIKEDMFSTMLNAALKDDLDMVLCDIEMYFEVMRKSKIINIGLDENTIYCGDELLKQFLQKKIHAFAWNKIYKRHLFDDIKYEEGVYYEDVYPMFNILCKVKKAKTVNLPFYVYRQRNNNISSNVSNKHIEDFNLGMRKVNSSYRKYRNYNKKLLESFNIAYLSNSLDLYIKSKNFNTKKIYEDYTKMYDGLPKYKFTEIMLNKYLGFQYKRVYMLWLMKLLPFLKKMKYNN
jgi:glycosyltransferase involved in cell wall biosynthesis